MYDTMRNEIFDFLKDVRSKCLQNEFSESFNIHPTRAVMASDNRLLMWKSMTHKDYCKLRIDNEDI
jgi:hypothetical protein